MGSVKFEVKAGEVTDLGKLAGPDALTPVSSDMNVDPRLAQWKVAPARYSPIGKLPNYFGVNVTRVQPIPSVIGYDRDRIIDLTGGQSPS